MDVFLVWHIRHARNLDGSPTTHHDEAGEVTYDDDFDDAKVVGIYSSSAGADQAIRRARTSSGFSEEPSCFIVDRYTLDQDHWTDGFISLG